MNDEITRIANGMPGKRSHHAEHRKGSQRKTLVEICSVSCPCGIVPFRFDGGLPTLGDLPFKLGAGRFDPEGSTTGAHSKIGAERKHGKAEIVFCAGNKVCIGLMVPVECQRDINVAPQLIFYFEMNTAGLDDRAL